MSEDDATGDMLVVSDEGGAAFPAVGTADLAAVPDPGGGDFHVIEMRGADGWVLDHPVQCLAPGDCPLTEAAGRISRAVCATEGRWTCDVQGSSLVLLDRLGG